MHYALAIVYYSRTGNTRAIAEYVSKKVGGDIFDLAAEGSPDLTDYDIVVVGGPVYNGVVPKTVIEAAVNAAGKRIFFFLCCMFDGEKGEEQFRMLTSELQDIEFKTYFPGDPGSNQEAMDDMTEHISKAKQ